MNNTRSKQQLVDELNADECDDWQYALQENGTITMTDETGEPVLDETGEIANLLQF